MIMNKIQLSNLKKETVDFWKDFFDLLKKVFKDIILLYKNVFHWIISKLIIKVTTFILWIVFAIPFILLLILICNIDPINWVDILLWLADNKPVWLKVIWSLATHPIYVTTEILLFVLWLIAFIFWYSYSLVLESKLYIEYLNNKKLEYLKNYYFNVNIIKKYVITLSKILLYLFIPIWLFFLVFLVFFVVLKIFWITDIWNSLFYIIFSKIVLILTVWLFFLFIYLLYRVVFSYVSIVDSEWKDKINSYVKESIKLSNWIKSFLKFSLISVILTILIIPFNLIDSSINDNLSERKNYLSYKYWVSSLTNDDDLFKYDLLKSKYSDIDDKIIEKEIKTNYNLSILYFVFSFFFINWIFTMFVVSFYKRELNKKKPWLLSKLWIWE